MKANRLSHAVLVASIGLGATPALAQKLEEVVVTAQKREQSLQDIPFSVSAMTGESLSNRAVNSLMDLQAITPSLMTPSTGSPGQGASFRLRGFGSPPFQLGIEPAVATFVDGVYRSRSGIAVNDLVDIDRVEVLKGPQGTLFGKNTTAGVVHVITNRPDLENTEGFIEANYEVDYSQTRLKGMINTPIGEKSALRVAAMWGDGDGWLENNGGPDDANDLNRYNINAQYLFVPNEDLDIRLGVSYGEIDEICCSSVQLAELEDLVTHDSTEAENDSTDKMYSLEVNWALGDMSLTSITSYQDYELDTVVDGDFVELAFLDIVTEVEIEAWTQELRLAGSTESLEWTVGAFYSDDEITRNRAFVWGEDIPLSPFPLVPGPGSLDLLSQDGTSWSVFAQGTYALTDALALTAGIRYNDEEKDGEGEFIMFQPGPPGPVNPEFNAEVAEDEPTGMVSLQYNWTDYIMTYATYQHGYKAGGINLAREAAGLPGQESEATFEDEIADNYEIGAKMDLWDDRVRLNVALFHTEYDDLQNQVLVGQSFIVRNGEGAEIDGIEIEGAVAATENLSFNVGLTWLDTEFDDGTDLGTGDLSGEDLPWAPELAAAVGWDWVQPLNGELEVFFSGTASYKDDYIANSAADPNTEQDSHTLWNSTLGIRTESWSASIWCSNCSDEDVVEVQFNNPLFGTPLAYRNQPLMYGVNLKYNF